MSAPIYDVGDRVPLMVDFGAAQVAVSAEVREPDGTVTDFTGGELTHVGGDGEYLISFDTTQVGEHEWEVTGDHDVEQGLFVTRALLVDLPPDQLQAGALCTLADVAKRVPGYEPGDDGEIDAALSTLILQESVDYLDYTNREIIPLFADPDVDPDDGEERLFDVDAFVAEERELPLGDATEILAVELRRADGTVVQTLDAASWVEKPRRRRQSWQPIGSLAFPRTVPVPAELPWPSRWGIHRETVDVAEMVAAVTAKWGFPEIPYTTRTGVATLVIIRYLSVADEGTPFAELANREDYNLGGWLKTALDFRERLRVPGSGE